MFRRFVLILVWLGLALQGAAVRAMVDVPCPMEATMQTMLAAGELDETDLADCCNDAQTFAATGQLCKSGHDGNASPTIGLPPAPGSVVAAPASAAPCAAIAAQRPAPVSLPWRPPAAR
ncbi:MAG: hypothetical protein KIT17_26995 [Rubrivivax sp.]|nr:hypothetical protein [Rubrivivax sp.]